MKKVDNSESSKDLLDPANFKENWEVKKTEPIENSPFQLVTIKDENDVEIFFVCMGDWRISEKFNSKKEAREDALKFSWNRLMQVLIVVDDFKQKQYEALKNQVNN